MQKYEHARRCLIQALGAASALAVLPRASAAAPPARRKKLIAWGWDTAYPAKIQMNVRKVEALPFDGIVVTHFKARAARGGEAMFEWRAFGRERFERRQLAETIDTLRGIAFERFTDNFLRFNAQPGDIDWFDDFAPVFHNARLWADIARETRMKGWLFDAEDYSGRLFTYSKQKHAGSRSFAVYADQARARGRGLIAAVQEAYPDITILFALAHSYVNRTRNARARLHEIDYGLLPAFISGMIEGAGPRVKLIDGQEQAYGYLTAADYAAGRRAVTEGALALVPDELRGAYRRTMQVGAAVWANYQLAVPVTTSEYWPPHYMKPAERLRLFEQNVYHALQTADEYAWLYSEQMSWWEEGFPRATPPGALDAIRSARAKLASGGAVTNDLDVAVAGAVARMKAATKR
jgi:hypothetical protein